MSLTEHLDGEWWCHCHGGVLCEGHRAIERALAPFVAVAQASQYWVDAWREHDPTHPNGGCIPHACVLCRAMRALAHPTVQAKLRESGEYVRGCEDV